MSATLRVTVLDDGRIWLEQGHHVIALETKEERALVREALTKVEIGEKNPCLTTPGHAMPIHA